MDTPRGAHLLLQTRTKVLNNEKLEAVSRRWYPRFRSTACPPRPLGGLQELLGISKRWLDECVTLKDNTFQQLLLLMRFPQVHSHSFATARRRHGLDLYRYKV